MLCVGHPLINKLRARRVSLSELNAYLVLLDIKWIGIARSFYCEIARTIFTFPCEVLLRGVEDVIKAKRIVLVFVCKEAVSLRCSLVRSLVNEPDDIPDQPKHQH